MDILEHLGMKVPDIEGHGVIISRASVICVGNVGIICSYVDRCRTVLVMSDVRARLLPQLHQLH